MTIWDVLDTAMKGPPDGPATFAVLCVFGLAVGLPVVALFVWINSLFSRSRG